MKGADGEQQGVLEGGNDNQQKGVVLRARPSAVSFEGANPRHEHEWKVFQERTIYQHQAEVKAQGRLSRLRTSPGF